MGRIGDITTATLESARLYRDLHLPLSSKLFVDISRLMGLYDTNMDATTFCQHDLSVVAAEVEGYADDMIEIHKGLLQDLREQDMKAQALLRSLLLEAQHRDDMAQALRKRGEEISKRGKWIGGLCAGSAALVFAVNFAVVLVGASIVSSASTVVCSLFAAVSAFQIKRAMDLSKEYRSRSLAETKRGEMTRDAAEKIGNCLIPALENFMKAVGKITCFLQKLVGDISEYAANVDTILAVQTSPLVLNLTVVKNQSARIQKTCGSYLDFLPFAKDQPSTLSQFGTPNPDYDKSWLMRKLPKSKLTTMYKQVTSEHTPLTSTLLLYRE